MREKLGLLALAGLMACSSPKQTGMTDAQKTALGDSVKAVATSMVDAINKDGMSSSWGMYSTAASARFSENGMVWPSVDAMKKMNADASTAMESIRITPDAVDPLVLGPDVVLITSPFHMAVKVKGKPDYTGQGVWSAVFQRQDGKWMLVSTHESMQHADAMMAALTPPKPKAPSKTTSKTPAKRTTTTKSTTTKKR